MLFRLAKALAKASLPVIRLPLSMVSRKELLQSGVEYPKEQSLRSWELPMAFCPLEEVSFPESRMWVKVSEALFEARNPRIFKAKINKAVAAAEIAAVAVAESRSPSRVPSHILTHVDSVTCNIVKE